MLHSLRVASLLLELGYSEVIVMAAVLHDVLEDTGVTKEQINLSFGSRIADLVLAVTYDKKILDEVERYKELYARTLAMGKDAVIIKAADLQINSIYVRLVPDKQKQEFLVNKEKYFLDLTAAFSDEPVWKSLHERYQAESARINQEK